MLITSQRRLNFGPSDQPAMQRRLSTYHFKSLANPSKRASTWLKKNPVEVLIWATEKVQEARQPEPEEEEESETDEERSFYEDGVLQQSEKEALQALSLDAALTDESAPAAVEEQDSEFSDSQSDASAANDVVCALQERMRRLEPESLRHRQVAHMLQTETTKRKRAEEARKEQHKRFKCRLRERGVSPQNLELVSSDLEELLPNQVERDLERYERKQMEAKEQSRCQAARKAFDGAWLLATERELKECCDSYRASDDPFVRANLKAYMRMVSEKLRDHHLLLGTYDTPEPLSERKRVCTALGLLSKDKQHLVTSVWERPPVMTEDNAPRPQPQKDFQDQDEDEDDDLIFMTPVPAARASCTVKRKIHSSSQRTNKAPPRNTIIKYLKSATQT